MRRALVSVAAVALGAAILLPTAAAAPPVSPNESVQPAASAVPAETAAPAESVRPVESALTPAESPAPAESVQPAASAIPAESPTPAQSGQPDESVQPDQSAAPADSAAPAESVQPAASAVPAESPPPAQSPTPAQSAAPAESAAPDQSAPPDVDLVQIDDGSLRIVESVQGGPADFAANFDIYIECSDDSSFSETIAFPEPGAVILPDIEGNAECWVGDYASPDPPEGYEWDYWHGTTIGDPATIVPHETVTITVVNRLRVIGTPGLYIEKYAYAEDAAWTDVTSVLTGTTVTYEIWVFNYGGVTLHHVTIEDDLVDVTGTECANVPDLKPDEEFECEYTDIAKTGTTKNTATVDSDETGPESAVATVIGYAEWPVTITKTNDAPLDALGQPTIKEGDTVSFTLTYTYTGVSATYGWMADYLPDGLTYVPGSATSSAEFAFEGLRSSDEDDEYEEGELMWEAEAVTTSGTVTYKATVDRGAAEYWQPLSNYVDLELDVDAGWVGDESVVFVAPVVNGGTSVKGETSEPTAPPTDAAASLDATAPTSNIQLGLVILAGISVAAAVAPTPASIRRRRNR